MNKTDKTLSPRSLNSETMSTTIPAVIILDAGILQRYIGEECHTHILQQLNLSLKRVSYYLVRPVAELTLRHRHKEMHFGSRLSPPLGLISFPRKGTR